MAASVVALLLWTSTLPASSTPTLPTTCDLVGVGPNVDEECRRRWVAREDTTPEATVPTYQDAGYALTVGPDGDRVYTAGVGRWPVGGRVGDAFVTAHVAADGSTAWRTLLDRGDFEIARDVALAPGGDTLYVAGSSTDPFGGEDGTVWALDTKDGALAWTAHVDGPSHGSDLLAALAVDPTTGTVVAFGEVAGNQTSGRDLVTVGLDPATGAELWRDRFDGPDHRDDRVAPFPSLAGIDVTSDGTAIVAGTSLTYDNGSDVIALAYDAGTGARAWTTRYDSPSHGSETGTAAVVAGPDRVVLAGDSYAGATQDWLAVGLDASDGTVAWTDRYDGPTGSEYIVTGLDAGGGRAFLAGLSSSGQALTGGWEYAAVAYDVATGDQLWSAYYSGGSQINDVAWAMEAAPDGSGVYLTGESYGIDPTPLLPPYEVDLTTVAFDGATGDLVAAARYDPTGQQWDAGQAVAVGPDGSVYVTGVSPSVDQSSDLPVVAYDTPFPEPEIEVGGSTSNRPVPTPEVRTYRDGRCLAPPGPGGALLGPVCSGSR